MKHPMLTLCLSATFCTSAIAQNLPGQLDEYFTTLYRNQQFNGNVLIAENGKIVYEKSFGYADFGTKRINTENTHFPIASITKTFTATAILQLKEKGLVDVDKPVSDYLPGFPYPSITIKHLLSHTSGLRPYDDFYDSLRILHPDTVFTNKDVLKRYADLKLPLLFQPGEDGNYSNTNFLFLALVVEKLSGITYDDYIKKNVFQPAGMTHTFFPHVIFYNYTPEESKNLSFAYHHPHVYEDLMERTDTIKFLREYGRTYNFEGFGEIVSTAPDLLQYDQAFYNGKLLKQSTLDEAFNPIRLKNGKINPVGNGLGWKIEEDGSFGKMVSHGGGLMGLNCILLRNITRHQTIIIFDNTQKNLGLMQEGALKILNNQKVKLPGKSIALFYGKALARAGATAAKNILEKLRMDTLHYILIENEFNALGYEFMNDNKDTEALETFKTNIALFPASWNVYDSYGEALLKTGEKNQAIRMYQKSVELNPDNENGKKVLKKLLQ